MPLKVRSLTRLAYFLRKVSLGMFTSLVRVVTVPSVSVSSLNISEALSIGAGKNLSAQQYGSVAISISDSSVSIGSITTALNTSCFTTST